jgi:hypothetical protein
VGVLIGIYDVENLSVFFKSHKQNMICVIILFDVM